MAFAGEGAERLDASPHYARSRSDDARRAVKRKNCISLGTQFSGAFGNGLIRHRAWRLHSSARTGQFLPVGGLSIGDGLTATQGASRVEPASIRGSIGHPVQYWFL